MAKVIIIGYKNLAELAYYYLTTDTEHTVSAFCVSEQYLPEENKFHDLPIVSFENIEKSYPKDEYSFFVPMSYKRMNRDREFMFNQVKEKGYRLISYIHSRANVAANVIIGENCFIMESAVIQPYAKIGDNFIFGGGLIGHHTIIKNNVFIGANVVISGGCIVENNVFIGAGSTIRDLSIIGEFSFLTLGAIISGKINPKSVYTSSLSKNLKITSDEFEQIINPVDPLNALAFNNKSYD
jgi:sugar O-acyltransferase (sialic acid O-acetyltransferase NeuD family)